MEYLTAIALIILVFDSLQAGTQQWKWLFSCRNTYEVVPDGLLDSKEVLPSSEANIVLPVTECAVPIDIVTEKLTQASLKKPTPAIIAVIPQKVPIITSTGRRVATTNPRRGFYDWWWGVWGYTFPTQIIHYLEVTQYEYFTFYDSYYYQDLNIPFIEKSKNIKLPKPLQGAALPLGQVPPLLIKMVTPTFHDIRLAKAMSHLPPLKYPDYFHGWIGQKKK